MNSALHDMIQAVSEPQFLYQLFNDPLNQNLVGRYALFKLGEVNERRAFLGELADLVFASLGDIPAAEADSWVIVTPATTELASDFSIALSQRLSSGRRLEVVPVGPPPHSFSDYTLCSRVERDRIVESFYDLQSDLSGKQILLIDDFYNTGTAIRELHRRLIACRVRPQEIRSFVFVRGVFDDPAFEGSMVSNYLSRLPFDRIVEIMAHRDHYATSATMLKYLVKRNERELDQLIDVLEPQKLAILRENYCCYYRNHSLPDSILRLYEGA